ncbi:kinase-like domain-containing protein, partial [Hyaloraphidium curvatum]
LGSGTFGPVDLAVHTATKESFALKRLATGQPIADPLERRMLMNELLFGQTLAHPNIIRTFEARRPANEIRLAMEVCPGGGLLKHLLEKGTSGYGLGEDEARRMFRQLVGAVAYLHKRSIAHRDLKLDNLLLDKDMNVKLIDFGMATFFDPEKPLTEWMGSIWYEAPEIHLEHPYRPDKIDVWALGIILYTLLVSQFPFSITDPRKAVHIITTTDLKLPSHCSPAAQRLFSRMCERDPGKRADIFEVLWDGWVN